MGKKSVILVLCGLVFAAGCFSSIKVSGTPEEILAQAAANIEGGDVDEAILKLNYLIDTHPDYIDAYCLRANAYAKLQRYPAAADDYTKVIELSSHTKCGTVGSVFYDRGYAYFLYGKPLTAAQDFLQEIRINPENAPAFAMLARSLRDECYSAKDAGMENWIRYCSMAIENFDKSSQLTGSPPFYFDKAVVYNCMEYYKNALLELNNYSRYGGKGSSDENIAYESGLAYMGLGEYQSAVDAFSLSINADSDNYEYYYRRGLA
jgi:tetratricopeptide (TPR) repeat protein